jgi:hypothetical protein
MSRRTRFTQEDVVAAIRAARAEGLGVVELKLGDDTTIVIRLTAEKDEENRGLRTPWTQ